MNLRLTNTSIHEQLYRQAILKLASSISSPTLLDLGSYDGSFTQQVSQAIAATNVICLDHDPHALKKARKRGFHTKQAELNQPLPIKQNLVNCVLANQVIEHLYHTDLFVQEIVRILVPGGHLIICTPNLASWHNIIALTFGFQPFSSQVSDHKFIGNPWHPLHNQPINEAQAHLRVFTHRSLSDLLSLHGLTIQKTLGVGYYPFSASIAHTLARVDPTHAAYILIHATKPKQ